MTSHHAPYPPKIPRLQKALDACWQVYSFNEKEPYRLWQNNHKDDRQQSGDSLPEMYHLGEVANQGIWGLQSMLNV